MKNLVSRSPWVSFLFILVVTILGGLLAQLAVRAVLPALALEQLALVMLLARSLIALALVAWLGWWADVGLNPPSQWRDLRTLWLLVPLPLLPLLDGVDAVVPARLGFFALAALLVALNEELLYRGLLLRALLPWGTGRAVAVLALLFSLIHLPNLLVGGSVAFELARLGMTLGGAVGLMAVRLRTTTLWPLIVAHWGLDFSEYIVANGIPALGAIHEVQPTTIAALVAYNLIFGLVGVYLLRRTGGSNTEGQPARTLPTAMVTGGR